MLGGFGLRVRRSNDVGDEVEGRALATDGLWVRDALLIHDIDAAPT